MIKGWWRIKQAPDYENSDIVKLQQDADEMLNVITKIYQIVKNNPYDNEISEEWLKRKIEQLIETSID